MDLPRAFVASFAVAGGRTALRDGGFPAATLGERTLVLEGRIDRLKKGGARLGSVAESEIARLLLEEIAARGLDVFADVVGDFVACVVEPERIAVFKSLASPYQVYMTEGRVANRLLAMTESGYALDPEYGLRFVLATPSLQYSLERTPLAGVTRLLPGHLAVLSARGRTTRALVTRRYGYLFDRRQTLAEAGRIARDAIIEAVEDRLARAPSGDVCCELSGGLDSSFVACLVAQRMPRVRAYMFARPELPSYRKGETYARSVADRYGIALDVLAPKDIPIPDLATQQVYGDEPTDFFWYGHMFERAAASLLPRGSRVFTGFGADQLFMRTSRIFPKLLRRGALADVRRGVRGFARVSQRSQASLFFQTALSALPRDVYFRLASPFAGRAYNPLSVGDVNLDWELRKPEIPWLRTASPLGDVVARIDVERREADERLVGDEVVFDDLGYFAGGRMVAGPWFDPKGIDEASPFCDLGLTDTVYGAISAHLVHDFDARYKEVLREAMRDIVPEDLRGRTSDTFAFDAFRNDFFAQNRDTLEGLLLRTAEDSEWVSRSEAKKAFEQLSFGLQTSATRAVLALLGYALWRRDFEAAFATAKASKAYLLT